MVARRYKAWSVVVIILALFLVSCASQTPQVSSTPKGDCQSRYDACLAECARTWATQHDRERRICYDECRLDWIACKK